MRTKLAIIMAAIAVTGCSDVHEDKAARDPAGISAQAERLPAEERVPFEAGANRGDPNYLAANPTVADAINEGRRVRAAEMKQVTDRSNRLLAQSRETESVWKACDSLPAAAKATCRAELNEKTMRQLDENRH